MLIIPIFFLFFTSLLISYSSFSICFHFLFLYYYIPWYVVSFNFTPSLLFYFDLFFLSFYNFHSVYSMMYYELFLWDVQSYFRSAIFAIDWSAVNSIRSMLFHAGQQCSVLPKLLLSWALDALPRGPIVFSLLEISQRVISTPRILPRSYLHNPDVSVRGEVLPVKTASLTGRSSATTDVRRGCETGEFPPRNLSRYCI
jgi:hypothetical protein